MDKHIERYEVFMQNGERTYPPPPILDMDPVIPFYTKGGSTGHLYIVKPSEIDQDLGVFKVGSTTQLQKRMYWYEPGTELLYCIYVPKALRELERKWIRALNRSHEFKLIRGFEYFSGQWTSAKVILDDIISEGSPNIIEI